MIRKLLALLLILGFSLSTFSLAFAGDETVNRHIFTGKEYDENTGLIYFGARYYDPDTGRFITQDSYLGEPGTPPSLNRYLYAYHNPTTFIDLLGYESVSTLIDNAASGCNGAGCFGWSFLKTLYQASTLGFASVHDPQRDAYDAGKISGAEYAVKGIGGGTAVVTANVATGRMAGAAMAGKSLLTQTAISASTGAGLGAFNDSAAQVSNIDTGAQQSYNYKETAVSALVGGSIGGAAPATGALVQNISARMAQSRTASLLTTESRSGFAPGERMPTGRLAGEGPGAALRNGPEFETTSTQYVYADDVQRYRNTQTGRFVAQRDLPYPPNSGFSESMDGTVPKGTIIDRYGRTSGRYAGELGATISERGLPPGSESLEYHRYEVLKPINAEIGPAAAVREFNAVGGAKQYYFNKSIDKLVSEKYLREVK